MRVALLAALAEGAARLPEPLAGRLARGLGRLLYAVAERTRYRGVLDRRIEEAFGAGAPEGPGALASPAGSLARRHVEHLLLLVIEAFRAARTSSVGLRDRIQAMGLERLEGLARQGRGVVVASAHLGNFEVLASGLAALGFPMLALMNHSLSPEVEALLVRLREAHGNRLAFNDGAGALQAMRELRRGGRVLILADQHDPARRVQVQLFGRRVWAPPGPVVLASRAGAALVPAFCLRREPGRFVLEVAPPLVLTGDLAADMQTLYDVYERWIRRAPEQWMWVDDRFRWPAAVAVPAGAGGS